MGLVLNRHIAHVDLDAFYASVEVLKNPRLRGKPVIVGGDTRGVVTSCTYEARAFKVKSGMPTRLAKRLCPGAIFVKGDFEKYSLYSQMVTDIIADEVPIFEKSSIDEFYIDMTGMDKFFGCAQYMSKIHNRITNETGLSVSHALASNKLVSKVAANEVKPAGAKVLRLDEERPFLWTLPVQKLPMIGDARAAELRQLGIHTIYDLSRIPFKLLTARFGLDGIEMWRRSNGIDESPIIPYHEPKSISTENTFNEDTIDIMFMIRQLVGMTEKIAFDLRLNNKLAGCITVKLKYSDFQTVSKQCSIEYTAADDILIEKVKMLFKLLYTRRIRVRLVGVRLSHLIPGNYQINLYSDTPKKVKLYSLIDSVKKQYGEQFLKRASGL
jgi:DNA polymerase IV